MINFTGPDDNFTMSNTDDSLFLRARLQQRDVVVRAQPPVSCQLKLLAHYTINIIIVSYMHIIRKRNDHTVCTSL